DSMVQHAAAGTRATYIGGARQLIYSTEVADIVLDIQPRQQARHFDLMGQILPTQDVAPSTFCVQLLQETTEKALTRVDEMGEFALEALVPGTYEIILSGEGIEIHLPSLSLHG
ncbi:MAG: hypothetical protein ACRDIB_20565, partial [Ardenticatenaceae bacterium]